MSVKQFFITRNSELQCSNIFKAFSLNNRLFAQNRAYIERIFNAFCDIVYMENEDSNGLLVYFLHFAYFLVTSKHDIDRKVTFSEPLLNP